MQLSDIEDEISLLLGDPSRTRWSLTVIDPRINAAEVDVLKWTNATKNPTQYTPQAGSNYVTVGANLLDILDATYQLPDGTVKGSKRGFNPISEWDLNFNRPNWRNESAGEPIYWSFEASNQRIVLVPMPDAASVVTNGLTLLEVHTPVNPVGGSTLTPRSSTGIPFDGAPLLYPYHRALVYWVVSECLKDNNDSDSLQKARYFRSNDLLSPGEYEKEIKQILMKFDAPEAIPAGVKYQPQGGRISGYTLPQKQNPLGWGLW